MSLSLSVCSQSGPPICTSFWAILRALRALKGPRIKFSHSLMHRPYRDLQNLKFLCLCLFSFSHKVVPQKASGRGGVGSGVVYRHSIVAKRKACLQPEKTQGHHYPSLLALAMPLLCIKTSTQTLEISVTWLWCHWDVTWCSFGFETIKFGFLVKFYVKILV